MNKHWSGRFTKATDNTVEEFMASLFFDYELAGQDLLGSLAHVQMLGQTGIITHEEAQEIRQGLLKVAERLAAGEVSFSAADEDIHMKIESELRLIIGPLAGKLHTARSRNDQVSLDLHLYLREKIVLLTELLAGLIEVLLSQAQANKDVIMPGYTHLQRAQPILFSHHLLAYVAMFQRDIERLQDSWPRVNQLPLGACALAGTGFPIDRQLVGNLLGFERLYENSIDAVSDRDFCVEFLAHASLIMMHLSRLSEELVLWCSQEFSFIELDDAYCTGSSIMPQKKNPDVPELVRGKVGRVYGSLMATLTLLKGLPLAYNKDLQEDKEAIFDTVKTLEGSLKVYQGVIATLHVHSKKMLQAAQEGLLNATEAADYLASKNMPFREAHRVVGQMVRYCLDHHYKLEDLTLEQFKGFSDLFEPDIFETIDLKKIVNSRNSQGGTSLGNVEAQCERALNYIEKIELWIADKKKVVSKPAEI